MLSVAFQSQIREALFELEAAGLLRRPLRISGPQGPVVQIDQFSVSAPTTTSDSQITRRW
jgi:hypothetical protein